MQTNKKRTMISLALAAVLPLSFALSACSKPVYVETGSTVIFDYNDGVARPYSIVADDGATIEKPATPVRKGYTFENWYTDKEGGTVVEFPYTVNGGATLYAHWGVRSYTVTFDMNHEDAPQNIVQNVGYGQTIMPPEEPTMNDLVFYRWEISSTDSAEAVFPYTVTGNVVFYAHWVTGLFNITFDNNDDGATESGTLKIPEGNKINNGDWPNPTRIGYEFRGWGTSADATTAVTFPYTPTENGTLYAIWRRAQYTINFRYNYTDSSGLNFKSQKVDGGLTIDKPEEDPVREGFTFEGWYGSAMGGEPIEFPYTPTKTTSFYAHWKSLAVETAIFDAEFTEIDPNEIFPGYSGSATGAKIIQADDTGAGKAHSESYPLNSKKPKQVGHFVTYLYKKGATLRFVIYSDKAVSGVKLKLRLGYEILETGSLTIGPSGKYAYGVKVNNSSLDYAPIKITGSNVNAGGMFMSDFADYEISVPVSLVQGENVIELTTLNETPELAGTTGAVAPMVDCIKLENLGGAKLHWYPVYDNLYI